MKRSTLQEMSASSLLTASMPTGESQPVTASQPALITAAVVIDAELDSTADASIGLDTCEWHQGTAVTCASPATCGVSGAFRGCGGIIATTPPSQASAPPLPQHSGFLKAPAGPILEVFLGAVLVFVLVAISCVIVTQKAHAARRRELRADDSRSSVTVSASPGRLGGDHDIPLSTSPEITRVSGGNKMKDRDDIERGSEAAKA